MRANSTIISSTQAWIDQFIIAKNICPFAKHIPTGKLDLEVDESIRLISNLETLATKLDRLNYDSSIETTLLIYPNADSDFLNFLDLFYACDQLVEDLQLRDTFQLVAFHPAFRFDNADENDAANYTNRSPYPMVHILRESSVSKAVDTHPDVDSIPDRNMKFLRRKSESYWAEFLKK